MRLRVIAAAIGLLLSFAGNAVAADENVAVSDWNTFCLASRGLSEVGLQRADEAGWARLPQGQGRYLDGEGGRRMLRFVGPPTTDTTMCVVSHPAQYTVWSALQDLL